MYKMLQSLPSRGSSLVNKGANGFSLIELMIVIVVIAVLASLSTPKLFSLVEFSRSAEAINTLNHIKASMNRCFLFKVTYLSCDEFSEIDIDNPGFDAGNLDSHFQYTINRLNNLEFQVTAKRNNLHGGDGNSRIYLTQWTNDFLIEGTGVFSGL